LSFAIHGSRNVPLTAATNLQAQQTIAPQREPDKTMMMFSFSPPAVQYYVNTNFSSTAVFSLLFADTGQRRLSLATGNALRIVLQQVTGEEFNGISGPFLDKFRHA
jgi:hypothetical protein